MFDMNLQLSAESHTTGQHPQVAFNLNHTLLEQCTKCTASGLTPGLPLATSFYTLADAGGKLVYV